MNRQLGMGIALSVLFALGLHASAAEPAAAAPGAGASADSRSGTVLESMDAGRYTYVRVQDGEEEFWAAGLQTKVAVGDKVELSGITPMGAFESPSLKRTFDHILFVAEMRVNGAPAATGASPGLPAGHPAIPGHEPAATLPAGHPPLDGMAVPSAPAAAPAALLRGEVIQTMVGGIYTYVEVRMDSGTRWLAAPEVALAVGQQVTFAEGMEMTDFASPSLGRTFKSLYFVPAVTPVKP